MTSFLWMFNVECHRMNSNYCRTKICFKAGTQDGYRPNEAVEVSHEKRQRLFDNVLRPSLKLFGAEEAGPLMPAGEKTKNVGPHVPYVIYPTVAHFRAGNALPVMWPSDTARKWARAYVGYHVITLREYQYWQFRNSDLDAWVRFGDTLGDKVVYVRDTQKADGHLDGRLTCFSSLKELGLSAGTI